MLTIPDGRQIIVTFLETRGNGDGRLGFEADNDILIHRSEIQDRVDEERRTQPHA